jgi:hypothetical protein
MNIYSILCVRFYVFLILFPKFGRFFREGKSERNTKLKGCMDSLVLLCCGLLKCLLAPFFFALLYCSENKNFKFYNSNGF